MAPCEDCGSTVIAGSEVLQGELATVEWCVNLACPSNALPPGLHRVGVHEYTCNECGALLATGIEEAVAHRQTHR